MTVVPFPEGPVVPKWATDRMLEICRKFPSQLSTEMAMYLAAELAIAEQRGCKRGIELACDAVKQSFAEAPK